MELQGSWTQRPLQQDPRLGYTLPPDFAGCVTAYSSFPKVQMCVSLAGTADPGPVALKKNLLTTSLPWISYQ